MNLTAKVLNRDADNRQRQECVERQFGADREHEGQRPGGKHNGVRRIHDRRPQQHAHRIQVVGGARHNVAGSRALVVRVRKPFEVPEQIIAEIKFDFAGNADHDPAGQKLENPLGGRHRQQEQRIGNQFVASDAEMKVVYGSLDYQRKQNPNSIGQENAQRTHHIVAAVLLEIGNQGTQTFRQHRLVRCDSISTSFSFAALPPIRDAMRGRDQSG